MLKKYKNSLHEIIAKHGVDPRVFEPLERSFEGHPAFILRVRETDLRFIMRSKTDNNHALDCLYTRYLPDFPLSPFFPHGEWGKIDLINEKFNKWVERHVQDYLNDLFEPDLWEQLRNQEVTISGSELSEDDTAKFSDEEKVQLRLLLNEFRLVVAETFKPNSEQMRVVDNRLHYLSESLERLNRFDWRSVLLTTTLSISVALSLDTARGKILFDLLKKVFSQGLFLLQ